MDLEIVILSEVSQTEEDKFPMISLICGILKKMMQMNLFTKQKVTHRHKFIVTKGDHGRWWEREKLGVCDQQIQTIIYKIDKQRPTVLN